MLCLHPKKRHHILDHPDTSRIHSKEGKQEVPHLGLRLRSGEGATHCLTSSCPYLWVRWGQMGRAPVTLLVVVATSFAPYPPIKKVSCKKILSLHSFSLYTALAILVSLHRTSLSVTGSRYMWPMLQMPIFKTSEFRVRQVLLIEKVPAQKDGGP